MEGSYLEERSGNWCLAKASALFIQVNTQLEAAQICIEVLHMLMQDKGLKIHHNLRKYQIGTG